MSGENTSRRNGGLTVEGEETDAYASDFTGRNLRDIGRDGDLKATCGQTHDDLGASVGVVVGGGDFDSHTDVEDNNGEEDANATTEPVNEEREAELASELPVGMSEEGDTPGSNLHNGKHTGPEGQDPCLDGITTGRGVVGAHGLAERLIADKRTEQDVLETHDRALDL
jgi:hypothetical protein